MSGLPGDEFATAGPLRLPDLERVCQPSSARKNTSSGSPPNFTTSALISSTVIASASAPDSPD